MKLGRNLKTPKVGVHYFVVSNGYQKTKVKEEVVVTSVGRKYFTVKFVHGYDEMKFSKEDFRHVNGEYSSVYNIYNDVDDYEKKTLVNSFVKEITVYNTNLLTYLSDDEVISLYKMLLDRKELYKKNSDMEFEEFKF